MANQLPLSTTSSDVAIDLGGYDTVFVAKQVAILSQNAGIFGEGVGGHMVHIDGTVASTGTAIWLREGNTETATGHYITLREHAEVFSYSTAIRIEHRALDLENFGRITGHTAIELSPTFLDDVSFLDNYGIIEAYNFGISAAYAEENIIFTNHGTLKGYYAYAGGSGVDEIRNFGQIIGQVDLAAGNDIYDARSGGTLEGFLDAGQGDDTIYGGAKNDSVYGAAGDDLICGGFGADHLYGGSGADRFLYLAASDSTNKFSSRDLIDQFNIIEGDIIDLEGIDSNLKLKGDQDFKFIGEASFHKKAGELRVQLKDGDTLVLCDIDGNGKADFVIAVDTPFAFLAEHFDL